MSPMPTPSESPLQKSGVSRKTERTGAEEGPVWGGCTFAVCPGLVPPQENGGCYNAIFSLERSQSDRVLPSYSTGEHCLPEAL